MTKVRRQMTRGMRLKSKIISKKAISVLLLLVVLIFSVAALSYAWYRNYVEIKGPTLTTGKLSLEIYGYDVDSNHNVTPLEPIIINGDTESSVVIESTVNQIDTWDSVHHVYYFIKNPQSDTAIELDGSVTVNLDNLEIDERLGGITVDVVEAQKGSISSDLDPLSQEQIMSAISQTSQDGSIILDGSGIAFSNLETAYREFTVPVGEYTCIRLTYEMPNTLADYQDMNLNVRISFCLAQKNGLPGATTNTEYTVYSLEGLQSVLGKYRPNDKIIVKSNIEYVGDLIFNRPVLLEVQNSRLDVVGNLIFAYPYQGKFSIDTSRGGSIAVFKKDVEQFDEDGNLEGVIKIGGNFDITAPLSQIEITGRNTSALEYGDIYVEGDLSVSASVPSASAAYGQGLIINGANIRPILEERGDTDGYKTINVSGHTRISIANYTEIGNIISTGSVIDIENRGIIGGIDLSHMVYDSQYPRTQAHININNYGTLNNTGILLPINWAELFVKHDDGSFSGNTFITSQPGSGFMTTNTTVGFKSDGSRDPLYDDIYYVKLTTYVEKVDGKADEIIVQYTNETGFYAPGTSTDIGTSLKTLLEYYMGKTSAVQLPNTTDSATEVSSALKISDLTEIKYLKIICYSTELTSADYTYIRSMKGLESIDISEASSTGLKTPDNAFKGMSNLKNAVMSRIDTAWGNYLFQNTKVVEVRLPDSLLSVTSANAFYNIKYIHTASRYLDYVNVSNSYRYVFVPDELTFTSYNTSAFNGFVFYDAERYSVDTGDYFLRLDDSNRTAELVAYRSVSTDGATATRNFDAAAELNGEAKFDFNSVTVNGIKYEIKTYGTYSFYKKTISNATEGLNLSEKMSSIEPYAFGSASGLGDLTINGSPTVDSYAFNSAKGIGALTVNGTPTIKLRAFNGAVASGTLEVTGDAVIEDEAFYGVTSVGIVLKTSLPIGANAFYGAKNTGVIDITNTSHIGESAFYNATSTTISINTDALIDYQAFRGATASVININTPMDIGERAFYGTKSTNEINITGSPNIGDYAFYSSSVVKLNAPDVVNTGVQSFGSASRLAYAYLPSLRVGDEPFYNCTVIFMLHIGIFEEGSTMGLRSGIIDYIFIHTDETDDPANYDYTHTYTNVNSSNNLDANDGTIFLPSEYANMYTNYGSEITFGTDHDRIEELREYYNPAEPFYDGAALLPNILYFLNEDGTITIFRYLKNSTNSSTDLFTIPKEDGSGNYEVSEIYAYAYRNTSITRNELALPDTVKILNAGAFYGNATNSSNVNKKIGRLDLSNVTTVGNSAFNNCDISIIEGYEVISAGSTAFANSEALIMIVLPKLTTITAFDANGYVTTFNSNSQLRVVYLGPLDDDTIVKERFFQGSNNIEYLIMDMSEKDGTSNAKTNFHNSNGGSYNSYPITLVIGSSTWGFHNSVKTDRSFSNIVVNGATTRTSTVNTYMSVDIPQYMFMLDSDGTSTLLRCTSVESGLERYEIPNRVQPNTGKYDFLGFEFTTCDILDDTTEGGYKVDGLIKGAYRMVSFGDTVFSTGPYITSIPSWMFYGSGLRYVELDNVVTVNSRAFDSNDSLVTIKMDKVETLGAQAFYDCDKYTSVSLPAIKTISTHVFAESSTLRSVTLGENLTSIGSETFRNDTALVEIINLSNSYVSFPSTLFVNGNNNKTVMGNIFLTVRKTHVDRYSASWGTKLGGISSFEGAFIEQATGLTYFYTTIDGTTDVELTLINAPDSYVSGDSIVLPNSFTSKNDEGVDTNYTVLRISGGLLSSIKNMSTVRSLTLPDRVTGLEGILGDIPNNIATLVLAESNTEYKTVDGVLYTKNGSYLMHYPGYKTDITFTLPTEVRYILDNAFDGCTYLQAVVINSPVIVMSEAFMGSTALVSVTFTSAEASVLLGTDMFKNCHADLAIYVPEASMDAYRSNVIIDVHIRDIITEIPTA